MKNLVVLFLLSAIDVYGAERVGTLGIVAFVPATSRTNVTELKMNSKQALYLLSNQVNSDVLLESQKIEIEGEGREALEVQLKKVAAVDRKIQFHLLINRLKSASVNSRPIFLRISAN